jgi:hypothetical protein
MSRELEEGGYRSHEFGESVLLEAQARYEQARRAG